MPTRDRDNPDNIARIKLYGKTVKNKQIAQELAKKMKGNEATAAMSQTMAGNQLGIKSPDTIARFAGIAKSLGYLGTAEDMKANRQLMSLRELMSDKLASHPLIREWVESMQVKKDGKPLKTLAPNLRMLLQFCRTLKIDPQLLLVGEDSKAKRDNVETYLKSYIKLFLDGKATVHYFKDLNEYDSNRIRLTMVLPLRAFLSYHGVNFPIRMGGIWSASQGDSVGKYADIRIDDKKYKECQKYLIKNFGMDSEILRIWCVGVEGLARQAALMMTPKKIEKITNKDKIVYTHQVYETKQEMYFPKYYTSEVCRHVIDSRQISDSAYMFDSRTSESWRKQTEVLKEFYRHFKFTDKGRLKPDDPETAYCIRRPTHTLRHFGAQRSLLLTGWNKDFVYPQGWKSSRELDQSYGEPPAEVRLKALWDMM